MTVVEQPSGTVTMVFTDIEGSTRLLEELGTEAYREALAAHRDVVRAACARYQGYEVDYEGDAFFYAFATAQSAVSAVSEAMQGLDGGPISIRVGIHTGEPALDPPKYVGLDVHRAARIMSAAHGGQVVLSPSTVSLLAGGATKLRDLGEHRLKDLSSPVRLYQLERDGRRDEFPRLKTLYRSNLPVPATPFQGRARELAEIIALIATPDIGLITLTGPGGTGKTRLGLQAAADAADHFPDGITWAPLASLRDPTRTLPTIADALGVKVDPGLTLDETLTSGLAGRRVLLLMDNAEHLLPELADAVAAFRRAVPTATVIVTSRERLRLDGERVYAVPSLAAAEGAELFLQRAQAFGVELEETPALVQLCARLDQLPLALELAAARTPLFSPAQLVDRLDERLDLLAGGRDADPRQHTLRSTISWSYDLLDVPEQQLFRRLAVFIGGCTYEAAEHVASAVPDTLQSLLDKSLVRKSDVASAARYWMLETVREYAAEKLADVDEVELLQQRHATFFAELVDEAHVAVLGPEQPAWLAVLDAEAANWSAALRHLLDRAQADRAAQMAGNLTFYWWFRGRADEGLPLLTACLEGAVRDPAIRAGTLAGVGELAAYVDDRELERRSLLEAREIFAQLGNTWEIARLDASLAFCATLSGDAAASMRYAASAIAAADGLEHPWLLNYVHHAAAQAAADRGDLEEAKRHIGASIRAARAGGPPRSLVVVLTALGWYEMTEGNYEAARALAVESLDSADPYDRELVAINQSNLGLVEMMLGRPASAAGRFAAALSAAPLGGRRIPAETMLLVAALAAPTDPRAAVRLWSASTALRESFGGLLDAVLGQVEDTTLVPLRTALDESEFDWLWEDGGSLPIPAAFDLATAEAERIAGATPDR